jgi:hexosaminidase
MQNTLLGLAGSVRDDPPLPDAGPRARAGLRPADPDHDFRVGASTLIRASGEAAAAGEYLAELLRPATGYPLPVVDGGPTEGAITLDPTAGAGEAYRLRVRASSVLLEGSPAGLFAGVQTLRQLLPAAVDATESRPGPWDISGGEVVDQPRFAHRGTMLDVARHFLHGRRGEEVHR